jgi:transcriptional regulator with XRE-family HTH domain
MKVDIGHKIKEVFDARGMKLTDFADELGTVRQNVYRIFKKRHLDTGLLLKISQVLNHNFFKYYVPAPENATIDPEQVAKLGSLNDDLQQQLELARKEIDYLRKIIKLMEEKAELIQQLEKDIIIH